MYDERSKIDGSKLGLARVLCLEFVFHLVSGPQDVMFDLPTDSAWPPWPARASDQETRWAQGVVWSGCHDRRAHLIALGGGLAPLRRD